MGGMDLLGLIVDVIGAARGEKLTKEANNEAKRANAIAEEAVSEAKGANSFAFNANQIAEQAYSVSERTLDASRDQTAYHWDVSYDPEEHRLVVRLLNARDAHDVSVIVLLDGKNIGKCSIDTLSAGEELRFPTTLGGKDFVKRGSMIGTVGGNTKTVPARSVTVDVYVDFTSDLGVARSDHFEVALRQSN